MSHTVYELDVRLREIEPPIWRAVQLPGTSALEDVHFAIQAAMGWENSHLHAFRIGDAVYGMVDTDEEGDIKDEREIRLQDVVGEGGSFLYEYDFGDGWEHDVTVSKVTQVAKEPRPRCVGGARACPPEDCGGTGGYQDLLEGLADPEHQDHEAAVEWAGGFEPERFAIPKAGKDLSRMMDEMRDLAESEGPEAIDLGTMSAETTLPRELVEAAFALEPMERAELIALLSWSLANEIREVEEAVRLVASAGQDKARRGRGHSPHGRRGR